MKCYKIKVNGKEFSVGIEEQGVAAKPENTVSVPTPVIKQEQKTVDKVVIGGEVVRSPMPGTVLKIKVSDGGQVKKGEPIVVLEAMKMENEIVSPKDGIVDISVNEGDKINSGDIIAAIV